MQRVHFFFVCFLSLAFFYKVPIMAYVTSIPLFTYTTFYISNT